MGSGEVVSLFKGLLCILILHVSCGQQYGHQHVQAAGGVVLKPAQPRRPIGGPAAIPGVDISILPGPLDVPLGGWLPAGAVQPYQPRRHSPPQATTLQTTTTPITTTPIPTTLHHIPHQPSQTTPGITSSIIKASTRPKSCYPNPCKNKGVCVFNQVKQPICTCRQLYLGNLCEVVVSPPKNISVTHLTSESIQITWKAPTRAGALAGFVVQYNEFGEENVAFSQIIHPSVTQFTLRDLVPGKQYTICISNVFKNVSNKKAVLRDQCREVKTKPLLLSEKGISVALMGTIVGCTILLLIVIMIIALFCQRRCMKKKAIPLRPLCGRVASARNASANRARGLNPSRNTNAATRDEYDTAKVHIPHTSQPIITPFKHSTNPFLSPSIPMHACANNANEPDYGNLFHNPHVIMMTHQTSPSSCAPPDVTETKQSMFSSDVFQCNRRLQRVSSVPPANMRALPVTISNHVMRTANARDMDASSEFDLHRTYFFPKF